MSFSYTTVTYNIKFSVSEKKFFNNIIHDKTPLFYHMHYFINLEQGGGKIAADYLGISSLAVSSGMRNNQLPIGFAVHTG